MRFLLFIAFLGCYLAFGQKDTVQTVEAVEVVHCVTVVRLEPTKPHLSKEDIDELQPVDAADLLQKFAGTNIKSYGGLGGLKTISTRSLGANHTAFIVDGFSMRNDQTGQVNVGQIQSDNIVQVSSLIGSEAFNLPVSSQVAGSSYSIETFESSFPKDTLQIRTNVRYGSFDYLQGYLAVKYKPGKLFVSAHGNYTSSDGSYPYRFENGSQSVKGNRLNNVYASNNRGVLVGMKGAHYKWRLGYEGQSIQQELPGAVILYNQTQDESMQTNRNRLFGDYVFGNGGWNVRAFATGMRFDIRYIDPDFLNSVGGIDITYFNKTATGGVSGSYAFNDYRTKLMFGVEEVISDLTVTDVNFSHPFRMHNYSMIGAKHSFGFVSVLAQVSEQYVSEFNRAAPNGNDRFRVNPYVAIDLNEHGRALRHKLWYRNSFRMPSFNELYYNNIGNTQLLPEDAHQFNYSLFTRPLSNSYLIVRANAYLNYVSNKIVAVPTKNLFVWSMQNVGETQIYGGDIGIDARIPLGDDWTIKLNGNYTLQKSIDVTDRTSPTYGHQIAYTPVHTANGDVTVNYKQAGIRFSNYYVSMRYALNENVPQNEVAAFIVTDVHAFYRFNFLTKNSLNLRFSVKNILDTSYAYIRSYVMPGRNFLISINYAFN